MADSTKKAIGKIRVGDTVVSVDQATGRIVLATVERRLRERAPKLLVLHLDTRETIETTPRQLFLTARGGYLSAERLKKGNRLRTLDGRIVKITRVTQRLKPTYVHTLALHGGANYHVGSTALRVPIVKEARPELASRRTPRRKSR
jgi:hypothetical protein